MTRQAAPVRVVGIIVKMKRLLPLLFIFIFSGCNFLIPDNIADNTKYDIPDHGFNDIDSIMSWLGYNIYWINDADVYGKEYFQNPQETYDKRAGDCEDWCILAMYMIKNELGLYPNLIIAQRIDDHRYGHAWIEVDGIWYDPQKYHPKLDKLEMLTEYRIHTIWNYSDTMIRSKIFHRSIK